MDISSFCYLPDTAISRRADRDAGLGSSISWTNRDGIGRTEKHFNLQLVGVRQAFAVVQHKGDA
ncbi:hypothetical protein FRX31_021245 [Thalictrum thalictroides]|uniref:Uncharacterized protein n=1 Tax=Thalictrum thalictroides TaxID=46969 RepID=A0A7J6VX36_THATH|nr:hypothetical protein FRX31_021245 [Thalictrum thalictroides]